MSVHVWSWVLKHSPAGDRDIGSSPVDRLVLLVLADHAHGDGTGAHPKEPLIAHEARCKKRSVYYALDALQAAGCIVQTGVHESGAREWQVLMTDAAASAKFAQRPTRKAQQNGVQTMHGSGANGNGFHANGDTHARVLRNRQEPSTVTATEPPLAPARVPAREGGEVGSSPDDLGAIPIPAGATARTVDRLTRTAERLGVPVIHDQRHQP